MLKEINHDKAYAILTYNGNLDNISMKAFNTRGDEIQV
jgi:hypothetical protein